MAKISKIRGYQARYDNRALPENVNLRTLEKRTDGSYLIRLEHIYDVEEDKVLSDPVTVSLHNLFPGFVIMSAEEAMLGGNQFRKDSTFDVELYGQTV
ncbi:hypothetical protein GHT06_013558 [Daphnia sinensis]|uniref:Glycosyl hydrolases family 38 C-terminal domain-containing protein n=1 Tax=Daphnia sinensis TaxID=1820382 RepID=A0AAD5LC81_9CRUS|nr:hypothetical protein GHT06_013558 [Daphnia sinensis]